MAMEILNLVQGSDEWIEARAKHYCASEASAMLGLSKKLKRNELLHMKATGCEREFSDWVKKNLLERGHAVEDAARQIMEDRLSESLYPIVGRQEIQGLPMLASLDGITMDDSTTWENKLWNQELVESVRAGEVPDEHWPQLEHQLLVSEAQKVCFTVSDGTEENTIQLWYESIPERRKRLIAGWKQFENDRASYVPQEVIPAAVAAPIKELPTLFIQARGEVTNTNMPEFKAQITGFLETINMKPATDQEFADGKEVAKKLRELAVKIKERKADMLEQTATIGEVAKEIDYLAEIINANALELEKAVKREEDSRKLAIVSSGKTALADHIAKLNERLGKNYMPAIDADFNGAIKSKRLMSAMQDAVDTLLANKKIEADAIADRIEANLNHLREVAKDYTFLFMDASQIVLKANDDFEALVKLRIADHKAEEERRLEAERARIRAEEEARAASKLKAEQEEANRIERERLAAEANEQTTVAAPVEPTQAFAPTLGDVLEAVAPAPIADAMTSSRPSPTAWQTVRNRVGFELDRLSVAQLELVSTYIAKNFPQKEAA